MASRWTQLAIRSHLSGAIDFSKATTAPTWGIKEAVIFRTVENDLLAKMHELLYMEHVILASAADDDSFRDEMEGAQSKFNICGRMTMPWLKWAPMKTAAQAYREAQDRRKDPKHMATLQRLQKELDDEARRLGDAVKAELELRKKVAAHTKELKQQPKRRRQHGGLSRRAPKSKSRR